MAASASDTQKKTATKKKPAARKTAPARKKVPAKKAAVKKADTARRRTTAAKVSKRKTAAREVPAKSPGAASGRQSRKQQGGVDKKTPEQPMMKTLRAEHRHIATVMQLFSEQLQAIEAGDSVDPHVVFEIMEYMATWPDRYHHPREDLIYSRVAELDEKTADEVDTLQRDHDQTAERGRKLLKDIESWREGDVSGSTIVKRGREYISHTYEHMNIEEKVVFPHIESVLTLEDWRELAEDDELRAISLPVFGPRVQREFRSMARRLRRSVRRGVEHGAVVEWVGIEALMESIEVLSLAYDSARSAAQEHWEKALTESKELFRESPVSAPLRCSLNNLKVGYKLLGDVAKISREVFDDLEQVNEERKGRIGLFSRD